jgi:hypothetical protein
MIPRRASTPPALDDDVQRKLDAKGEVVEVAQHAQPAGEGSRS